MSGAAQVPWQTDVLHGARALVERKLAIRDECLRGTGYASLAELGHDRERRELLFPARIATEHGDLQRLGCGFRGPVYSCRQYAIKVNYNLSFEIGREWQNYCDAVARVGQLHQQAVRLLELNLGSLYFPATDTPVLQYRVDPFVGEYFREERVLVKELLVGKTIHQLATINGLSALVEKNSLLKLAELFHVCGSCGVLLQGDPHDFILTDTARMPDGNRWVAIDPDGWVCYPVGDPYANHAAQRAFVGTFTRDWGPQRSDWETLSEPEKRENEAFLQEVDRTAQEVWRASAGEHFNAGLLAHALASEDLLTTRDPVLRAFVRSEYDDPLRLDVELGRCSLNVLLTTRELALEMIRMRGADGLEAIRDFYFHDLDFIASERHVIVFNPYNDNDNERSRDWAYNHTGIRNSAIARRVLEEADRRNAPAANFAV